MAVVQTWSRGFSCVTSLAAAFGAFCARCNGAIIGLWMPIPTLTANSLVGSRRVSLLNTNSETREDATLGPC